MGRARLLERGLPDLPVLAADTAVVLGERIFGKPRIAFMRRNADGAFRPDPSGIDRGSGGCTKWDTSTHIHFYCRFRDISEREIAATSRMAKRMTKPGLMQFKVWRQFSYPGFPAAIVALWDCLYTRRRNCWKSPV